MTRAESALEVRIGDSIERVFGAQASIDAAGDRNRCRDMLNSSEVMFKSLERTDGSAVKAQEAYGDPETSAASKRRGRSSQWQHSGGASLNRIGQKTMVSGEQTIRKSQGGKNDIW